MLIIRKSKLYYTASGIITTVGDRPMHRLRADWSKNAGRYIVKAFNLSHLSSDV